MNERTVSSSARLGERELARDGGAPESTSIESAIASGMRGEVGEGGMGRWERWFG